MNKNSNMGASKSYKLVGGLLVFLLILTSFKGLDYIFAKDARTSSDSATSDGTEDLTFVDSFNVEGSAYKWININYKTNITNDTSNFLRINKNSLHLGNTSWLLNTDRNSATMTASSKFNVNLNKSFIFDGSTTIYGRSAGSFFVGLSNDDIGSLFYEVDLANDTSDGGWEEPEIGSSNVPHIGLIQYTNGSSSPTWYATPTIFSYNTTEDKRKFIMEYDAENDVLNISWGTFLKSYTGARNFLGEDVKLEITGCVNAGARNPVYTGGVEMDIQVDSFKYTDAVSKSTIDYYTTRNDTLVKYDKDDVSTYPRPGETVLVRNTIYNDLDTATDQSATANIPLSQVDGANRTPSNLKMYTGSPSEPVNIAIDESDIFNGSVNSEGLYKQVTVPLLKNKGTTYIEYEYTIPIDKQYSKLDDAIVFGQKGMTQTTFSNCANIAYYPDLKGVNNTVSNVLSTGIMSDSEIKDSITGKLFDASDYSDLSSSSLSDMLFSYTVDGSDTKTIDKAKEGRYRIDYTLKDNRTSLTDKKYRYIWNTDKKVVINDDESIAAQDFTMMCEEVKDAQGNGNLIDIIKTRSGVDAYENDGTQIPLDDIRVTHAIKARAGNYKVTFTTPSGVSTTVNVNCSVYEHSVVDPITGETIFANDFTVSEDETSTLDDDKLMKFSNVKAKDRDGKAVSVRVSENTVKDKTVGRYKVTFVTNAGTSITVNAQVTKQYIEANGEKIRGNDFYVSAKEVKNISDEQLIALAKVEAIDIDTNTKLEVHVNDDALKPEKGTYAIMYSTDKGTSLTLIATVSDRVVINPDTNEVIYANNFSLEQAEARNISDETIILKSNAKAFDMDGGNEIDITKVTHDIKALAGLYDVVFETEKETKLAVISSIPNTVENDTLILAANDFTTCVKQVEDGLDDTAYIKMARARAKEKETANDVRVLVSDKREVTALPGTYPITFATDYVSDPSKNLSLPVKMKVTEEGVVDSSNKESLFANNIYLKKSEVAGLSIEDIIKRTSAVGYNTDTGEYIDIFVEHTIKELVGTYDIELTTIKGTQLTVKAYVFDTGIVDETTLESIYANNVTINKDEVETLSDQILKDKANVKAYQSVSKEDVEITKVNRENIKAKKGTYVASFETLKGTKLDIQVRVVDHEKEESGIKLVGDDIYLSVEEVNSIDEDKIIELSKAEAIDTTTMEPKEVHAEYTNVKNKVGIYDITLKAESVELVIQAHVYDKTIETEEERIYGNDFSLSIAEADRITDTRIKELSKVVAYDKKTGQEVAVQVSHNIKGKKGVYEVTFTTDQGTTLRVLASVREDVVEANGERISANAIRLTKDEVALLTEQIIIEKAHAQAVEERTGKIVDLHVDYSAIKEVRGTYDVVFTTDVGTSLRVDANVFDEGIIDETTREAIYANDFIMGEEETENLKTEDIKKKAKAYAINLDTGEDVEITEVEHTIKNAIGEYPIVFKTEKKTEKTIKADVVGKGIEDDITNEAIQANDIYITKDEVDSLNEEKIISLSDAKAYDLSSKESREVFVDYSAVKKELGCHNIILTTAKGTTLTIHAYVREHEVIDDTTKEKIVANDFVLSKEEADGISDKEIIKRSKVKAFNTTTYEDIKITKIEHSIRGEKGKYEVLMYTAKETSIRVIASVYEHKGDNTVNNEAIYANDIILEKEEVKMLTSETLIKKANAYAIEIETKEAVKIEKVEHTIKAKTGQYQLRFITGKGTSVSVKATVFTYREPTIEVPRPNKPVEEGNSSNTNQEVRKRIPIIDRYYEITTSVSSIPKEDTPGGSNEVGQGTGEVIAAKSLKRVEEACYWHWGMLIAGGVYAMYMMIVLRKEEE